MMKLCYKETKKGFIKRERASNSVYAKSLQSLTHILFITGIFFQQICTLPCSFFYFAFGNTSSWWRHFVDRWRSYIPFCGSYMLLLFLVLLMMLVRSTISHFAVVMPKCDLTRPREGCRRPYRKSIPFILTKSIIFIRWYNQSRAKNMIIARKKKHPVQAPWCVVCMEKYWIGISGYVLDKEITAGVMCL